MICQDIEALSVKCGWWMLTPSLSQYDSSKTGYVMKVYGPDMTVATTIAAKSVDEVLSLTLRWLDHHPELKPTSAPSSPGTPLGASASTPSRKLKLKVRRP